jgi:ubiquinone biosynthesis monooxygenase Coq7
MDTRSFSLLDRLIGEIDKAIKVLAAPARAPARASREPSGTPGNECAMNRSDTLESGRLMRVNHSGEVAAQALYQGQALTSRNPAVTSAMHSAAAEEMDHLAWCENRLTELGRRPSFLNPLWYAGSFAMGALAGVLGDRTSLGFIAETETQVEAHLRDHLERLPAADTRSRAILEQMKHEEAMHGAKAANMGGRALPLPLRAAMRMSSRVMTYSSYWL